MALDFRNSKTNFLSVSGILLLFCFQQFILYYSIYYLKRVNVVLYALIIDVPLDILLSFFGLYVTPIVFLLFNNASKCSLFQDKTILSVDELLHSDLGLSTTIDLWDLILMFSHLLKYYKVELKEGKRLIIKAKLFVIFIIFVLTTIFLLGLVIPTVDGDYKVEDKFKTNIFNEAVRLFIKFIKIFSRTTTFDYKKHSDAVKDTTSLKSVDEGSRSLDMFTMAKFTFIIGFFLVDIPFLCYRLYILVKYNVFSLLLYKNFIFLFLRPYRLNMSQLAERDTAKGVQTAFLNTDLLSVNRDKRADRDRDGLDMKGNSVSFNLLDESENDSESEMLKRYSRKGSILRKRTKALKSAFLPKLLTKLSFNHQRTHTKSDPVHLSSKLFSMGFHKRVAREAGDRPRADLGDGAIDRVGLFKRGTSYVTEGSMRDGMTKYGSTDSFEHLDGSSEHANHYYKMYVLKILKRRKVLPIKSFPASIILRHWCHFMFPTFKRVQNTLFANISGFMELKLSQITLVVAFLLSVVPRVALVFLYYSLDIRSPREIVTNFTKGASFMEKFMLEMCFGFSFVLFVLFLSCCRVYDTLFSFGRDLLNLYSTMVCLHCFKSILREYDLNWLLFVFLLHPAYSTVSFVINLLPFKTNSSSDSGEVGFRSVGSDDTMGGRMDYYGTAKVTGDVNNVNANASSINDTNKSNNAGPLPSQKAIRAKMLSLKVVYFLLKFSIGPVTLNHLLCSLDMVQTFKIHDSLLYSQWSHFFYSFFFRIVCCFNLDSTASTVLLLVDLAVFFLYNAMSQSVRSLMFRKYEVNFIVMRLLGLLRFDWDDKDSRSENCVTFADVDKYIKLQGLFSSPGIIIPPFV
ncbi:hypothetical protein MACJ_002444 [Theileria orientalis]|uniref:Uncharacterized protein n=1 Tax=Theileria orientalis TaxID=68886 RepID=A0A976M681_THEOR|nr:hypothetical protein MACJ_002444 [Theileria orientalis]